MISTNNLASKVSAAGEQFIVSLNVALNTAKDSCSPEEFERFKKAIGTIIGTLEIELLWPLYKQHPDLEPESLKGCKNET
jgi:hypothetical protein